MSKDFDDDFEDNEEFSDEDFEFIEEESEDEESGDEEVGEYIAIPFFSMFATNLPEKFNPNEIFKQDKILLYNPIDKLSPYRTIQTKLFTIETLQDYLVISNTKSLEKSFNLIDSNELTRTMEMNKSIMKSFDPNHLDELDNKNTNKYKNKFKK